MLDLPDARRDRGEEVNHATVGSPDGSWPSLRHPDAELSGPVLCPWAGVGGGVPPRQTAWQGRESLLGDTTLYLTGILSKQMPPSRGWLLALLLLLLPTLQDSFVFPPPSRSVTGRRSWVNQLGGPPVRWRGKGDLLSTLSAEDKERINVEFEGLLTEGRDLLKIVDTLKRNRNHVDLNWERVSSKSQGRVDHLTPFLQQRPAYLITDSHVGAVRPCTN